jgi:N-acetyl-gamma-glutamyl-phosphate reductase
MEKIKVGIIGAAGYTAGELLRILIHHQQVDITQAQSESQAGKLITMIHADLIGDTDLVFSSDIAPETADVFFLCKGHGESKKILDANPSLLKKKIVDLSQDFRLAGNHDFVYGLPEFSKALISKTNHVANPGCFATCIQLGILPALRAGIVQDDIHVSGITGSTGAGQSFSTTSHFSWRQNNASVYKPLEHQHLLEIGQSIVQLNPGFGGDVQFIPYRGAFTRGIICTSYFETNLSQEELMKIYQSAYHGHPFTSVSEQNPDLKMVVNTNKAVVYPMKIGNKAVVISVIDNLLKGASGQAVQNMNLMCGLAENEGLNLKASAF